MIFELAKGEDQVLDRIERSLDLLARRHEALAANLANIDTPGYQTIDLRFDEALETELGKPWPLVRTSPTHFEAVVPESSAEPRIVKVEGLPDRPDGNNVQMERELLGMNMNRLRFEMTLQWARNRIRTLQTAIEEGRPR